MLFELFYELHLSLQNDSKRNLRFKLPPVRLDVFFLSIKRFNVAPAQLCVPMSDYAF